MQQARAHLPAEFEMVGVWLGGGPAPQGATAQQAEAAVRPLFQVDRLDHQLQHAQRLLRLRDARHPLRLHTIRHSYASRTS